MMDVGKTLFVPRKIKPVSSRKKETQLRNDGMWFGQPQ